MREILFRGKHNDSCEWKYGDLLHATYSGETLYWIMESKSGWEKTSYSVAPDTVGQFTERYDMDQKHIFEHDIVVYKNVQFVVYFDFGAWKILHKNGYKINLFTIPPCDIAVIGNIHENPEFFDER